MGDDGIRTGDDIRGPHRSSGASGWIGFVRILEAKSESRGTNGCPRCARYNNTRQRSNGYDYPNSSAPHGATLSNDGFYYTPNQNITHDIAEANGCLMNDQWIAWPTKYDGQANWTCGMPFGACPAESPLIRCTWH